MDVRERFCMNSDGQLNPFSGYGLWMNGDGLLERVPLTALDGKQPGKPGKVCYCYQSLLAYLHSNGGGAYPT